MTDAKRDEGQDVNAIRDILFGQQMRDYEQRFGQLEAALAEKLDALRSSFDTQLEQLQQQSADKLQETDAQQQAQARALQENLDGLNADMQQMRQELITSMTDQVDAVRNSSVARTDLAEWLRDLAGRIDGQ